MTNPTFDVALSFAGEDRAFVHEVATALHDQSISVFYDEFNTAELWGKNLYTYLDEIYGTQCRYVMVFSSAHYAQGIWTSHERHAIQARLMSEPEGFLLLVRLDDTHVAGFPATHGYLDGHRLGAAAVADHLLAKLDGRGGIDLPPPLIRVPLTSADRRRLLGLRPAGWEHLLLAGTVWQEWLRLAPKRHNQTIGYGPGPGQHIPTARLADQLRVALDELAAVTSTVEELLAGDPLRWAMGDPGVTGDAERIEHLGHCFGSTVEALLDWAARQRSSFGDPAHRTVLARLAGLADEPVQRIGTFVNDLVAAAGHLADAASGQARTSRVEPSATVTLDLGINDAALNEFRAAVAALGLTRAG